MYIWAFDDLYIHNFKAIGCENPERSLKSANKKLWKRFQKALTEVDCDQTMIKYIDWETAIEKSTEYNAQLDYWMQLYRTNQGFRHAVMEAIEEALVKLQRTHFP